MKKIFLILILLPFLAQSQVNKYYKGVSNADTGRGASQIATGGSLNKVRDSLAAVIVAGLSTNKYVNVLDYGADPTGTIGSALYIQNAINTGLDVYIPEGTYKIEGVDSTLTPLAGQTIFGEGRGSILKTTTNGATTNLSTAMNIIKLINKNSTVRGIYFLGNGETTYSFPWSTQNGIWVYSDNNVIQDCYFKNLRGFGILGVHPSLSLFKNNTATNFYANNCTGGIFNYVGSEYWNIGNFIIDSCNAIGINEHGANNNYHDGVLNYNATQGRFSGNGSNSDHTYITNVIFNHGTGVNLDIDNTLYALTFTNCGFWSAATTIDQCVGVSFNGCQFGTSANVTVTASSTVKPTYFYNCFEVGTSSPTFTESGTGKIVKIGKFNNTVATGSYQINTGIQTAYVAKSGSYTLTAYDNKIEVTATGQTMTLPTAVGVTGQEYTIKLTASGSCTVATTSSQTIDGSTTYSLVSQYKYVTVQSNGANWIVIANN